MKPEILKKETVHKGWTTFLLADMRLPSGETSRREILSHGEAAVVLPFDPARRVATLVRQFRPPAFLARQTLALTEAIAGMVEDDDGEACARREALEEAGLRLRRMENVGTFWVSPGISTERMILCLAEYEAADRVGEGGGADGEQEDIEVLELPLAELARMADAGEIDDLKTMTLVQTLRLKRPELFR